MSYALLISEQAEADLADAIDWHRKIQPGLDDDLLSCVEQAINRIVDNPNAFTVTSNGSRQALVRRFLYSVMFRVRGNRVEVEAIFHASKDPATASARNQRPDSLLRSG